MQQLVNNVTFSIGALVPALLGGLMAGCDNEIAERRTPAGHQPVTTGMGAEPSFVDATRESGIEFRHFLGATGDLRIPEIMAGGAGLLDYDGDGDLDAFFTQGTVLTAGVPAAGVPATGVPATGVQAPEDHAVGGRLYRNDLIPAGVLRFVDVTEQAGILTEGYGMGLAVGDVDNDGYPDLYVTGYGRDQLYRNNGNGTFSDVTAASGIESPRWSTSASFFDYDRDGRLDLFVAHYVDSTMANHEPCLGPLGAPDYCGPAAYEPLPDRLYRNRGDFQFVDVTAPAGLGSAFGSGLGVVAADLDDDGWPDLYVANDGNANQLWINRGDGGFEDRALLAGAAYNDAGEAEAGMGIAVGDVDRDGDDDLFVTHLINETNTLYLNDGAAEFLDATRASGISLVSLGLTGFGAVFFDYDLDGWLDLYVANGAVQALPDAEPNFPYAQGDRLLRNEKGRFRDVTGAAGPALGQQRVGRAVAAGDIDNDGDVDLLVANINGRPQLLLNTTARAGTWLRLELVGDGSNRDAIGARVGIGLTGGATHWQTISRDGSYLAARDPRAHFGVPAGQSVESIEVRWPSGKRETWPGPAANAGLLLLEGSGTPAAGP